MTHLPRSILTRLALFRRSQDGGPTVSFVILFMPFMFTAVLGFEMGLLMTRHAMLERGLDMAVREVRLNSDVIYDETDMKRMICNAAGILPNCLENLRLEMRTVDFHTAGSTSLTAIPGQASCVDLDDPFQVPSSFENGAENQVMFVRACGIFSPMLAQSVTYTTPSGQSGERDGYYRLVATSAFVMEPQ